MTVAAKAPPARFLEGSIMRHVVVMTLTGALGLMAVFLVDLADLYFLSRLGNTDITAAIGFAGTLSFANLSLSIGTGIAAAALVARNMGSGNTARAKEFATSVFYFTLIVSAVYTLLIVMFLDPILRTLGAEGAALEQAKSFIRVLTPGFICLACALSCSFSLRGLGDARRAMFITLAAAITTLILDPIFIFTFGWGIEGAAAANAIADAMAMALGLHGLVIVHKFIGGFALASLKRDFSPIAAIAFPSILTQLATPFANAYMTYVIARFGNDVVTASTIIGRLVPVAFGIIFSLSGSVGPIIGQNYGAKNFDRVSQALRDGMKFAFIYTLVTSAILFLFRQPIADLFHANERTTALVSFFATYIAVSWAFVGMLFVANAAFNNLGKPAYSTYFNWGRATLGTIPFALVGVAWGGAEGMMAATAIGSMLFGLASAITAFWLVKKLNASG
ncbi:MAG: MATE family efflux transporter [Alphaproteobacteria bacterium]|nr:MATE family efflux transporter [Alphaproteobacteria bacterium]